MDARTAVLGALGDVAQHAEPKAAAGRCRRPSCVS